VFFLCTFRWSLLHKPAIATNDIYLFGIDLTPDEAIHFTNLELIANHFNNLSLTKGDDAGAIVGIMARSGSPSLYAILEESPSEDDSALREGESSGFPIPRKCNMMTSAIPIVTMPPLEETPTFQTILAVPQRTAIPRLDTRPLPE
jgi:hypothetical protein